MTANEFRRLALSFPEAVEAAHMNHPDFRVGGKVFATLGQGEAWGMVKLTPGEQPTFLAAQPEVFHPASGAWGRRGCTIVQLKKAKKSLVKEALAIAWRSTAPPRLVEEKDGSRPTRSRRAGG